MARSKKPASKNFARQQFYEGVARCCLREAWCNLDGFRKEKRITRVFRGEVREDRIVSRSMVADYVNHDASSVNKWFRGESSNWSYLSMVMMALGANWEHVAPRPSKPALIRSGWRYAIRQVRSRLEGRPLSELEPPTLSELQMLQDLFQVEQWRFVRRIAIDREEALCVIAAHQKLNWAELESLDAAWGDAWNACLDAITFWLEQLHAAD